MSVDPKINAFDECLEHVLNGESVEAILARYPQWAAEFEPMLQAALATRLLRTAQAPKANMARSRARMLIAARSRRQPRLSWSLFPQMRAGLVALVLLMALMFGSLSTVAVSAQALPGDTLYPVKILTEQTRLFFTKDASKRLKLERSFDQQRTQEVDALIRDAGRSGRADTIMVTFAGGLLKFDPELWLVDDIRVSIVAGTQVIGELREGYYVGVQGILQPNGIVLAQKMWTREYDVKGVIRQMSASEWLVDNVSFVVGPDTHIDGTPQMGSRVEVSLAMRPDGTFQAQTVKVLSVAPTSTLQASPTLRPTNTLQPSDTARPRPSKTPKPTQASGDDGQDGDHDTPEPSETPKPTDDDGDDEHETPQPSETRRPTRTPQSTEDDHEEHETPEHSPTLTAGGTQQPSRTPEPTDDDDD